MRWNPSLSANEGSCQTIKRKAIKLILFMSYFININLDRPSTQIFYIAMSPFENKINICS